jgi:hypothetical protein
MPHDEDGERRRQEGKGALVGGSLAGEKHQPVKVCRSAAAPEADGHQQGSEG